MQLALKWAAQESKHGGAIECQTKCACAHQQTACAQASVVFLPSNQVRAAIFSMIQSQSGSINSLPEGSRWLDLFAGTGSVGLEAVSRGSEQVCMCMCTTCTKVEEWAAWVEGLGWLGRWTGQVNWYGEG